MQERPTGGRGRSAERLGATDVLGPRLRGQQRTLDKIWERMERDRAAEELGPIADRQRGRAEE